MNLSPPPHPFLLAGCGPTLRVPDGDWSVVTLNRAICFFDSVYLAFVYHSTTLEAVVGYLGKVKCNVIFPTPFDSYLEWREGWSYHEDPRKHPLYKRVRGARAILARQMEIEPRERAFQEMTGLMANGPCSVGALGYLVRWYGIREIHTVGIDGGALTAGALHEAYSNRNRNLTNGYDKGFERFKFACAKWEIKWTRL